MSQNEYSNIPNVLKQNIKIPSHWISIHDRNQNYNTIS